LGEYFVNVSLPALYCRPAYPVVICSETFTRSSPSDTALFITAR